jgi:hypothetical protein
MCFQSLHMDWLWLLRAQFSFPTKHGSLDGKFSMLGSHRVDTTSRNLAIPTALNYKRES